MMPQASSKAISLEPVAVSNGLTRMSQLGRRPPISPPKIPMATPKKKTMLNPNVRFFSLVNRAIVGERATAQITENAPPTKAKTRRNTGETKVVRNAETIETRAKQRTRVFRGPRRCSTMPEGKVPATPPKVTALVIIPTKFSLKPLSSRYRLYRKKKTYIPRLNRNDAPRKVRKFLLVSAADQDQRRPCQMV